MKLDYIKALIICIGTAISAWLGNLAMPVYILLVLNVMDYITGLLAAPHRGEMRNSHKGYLGIVKKVCIIFLVAVGAIVDWVIIYAGQYLGITVPFKFLISIGTAIWLICNEIISILENVGDIGVPLPRFLEKAIQFIKKSIEEKEDRNNDDKRDH